MKEINDIIKAFEEARRQQKQSALATVVHVNGSSYRRPGARMLVTEDGQLTGAISGGCLEGDALRKALLAMTQKKNMLVVYDTSDEDDAKLGMGLGCEGIIHILIEPIDVDKAGNPIEFLKAIAGKRQKAVLISLFSFYDRKGPQPGTCLLFTADGDSKGKIPQLQDIIIDNAKKVMVTQQSSFKQYVSEKQEITAFIEMIKPEVSLIIIGAGNDVIPLVALADVLGWQTTVVDGRSNYAKAERFTKACQVVVSKPENVLNKIEIDDQTVFALMTHNYNYDMAMLNILLKKEVVYVGMLGPRKKREKILSELKEKGMQFSSRQLSLLHSPIGLDIGAETPEEIALSIVAEIKAVLSGKQTASLNGSAVIHPRSASVIEEVKLDFKQ